MGYQDTNFKICHSLFGCEELKLPNVHIVQWKAKGGRRNHVRATQTEKEEKAEEEKEEEQEEKLCEREDEGDTDCRSLTSSFLPCL